MKAIIISMLCLLPLFANAQTPATLTISGSSTTEVTPDITVINISINALDKDYATAMDMLQDKANSIKSFLAKNDIEKEQIKAETFNIDKSFSYADRKKTFIGYEATLRIKLEFLNNNDHANKIINTIGESNTDADVNVGFRLSQELTDKTNNKLIETAILDAKKKANIIAKTTEKTLGEIIKINYGVQDNFVPMSRMTTNCFAEDIATEVGKSSLSITPQPEHRSTDIIIYWSLQ